jgi:hypothetical protein
VPALKTELIKMAVEKFETDYYRYMSGSLQLHELCCFVAALLHSELSVLNLPKLVSTGKAWMNAKSRFDTMMKAVGAESPGLKLLHVGTSEITQPLLLTKGSPAGDTFFKMLPRLGSLRVVRLDNFQCDNWALRQFAMHTTNLV